MDMRQADFRKGVLMDMRQADFCKAVLMDNIQRLR